MSVLLQDRPVRPVAPVPARRARRVPLAALLCAGLLVVGLLAAAPSLVLVAMVAAAASACRGRVPRGLALPAAVAGLLLVAVLVGGLGAVLGLPLLTSPAVLVLVAGACLAASAAATPALPRPAAHDALAQAPALLALAVGAVQAVDVRRVAGWSARGTDFTEHTVLLGVLRRAGSLSYDVEAYPRALHALLVLVSSGTAPAPGSAALLVHDLRLMGWASWAALALLLSVAATVVRLVARRRGASERTAALAAAATGAAALQSWTFLSVFLSMAAAPGLVTVVVLTLLPLTAWLAPRPGAWTCTAVTAAVTVLVAHLWPALLPVAALGWAGLVAGGPERAALRAGLRRRELVLPAVPLAAVLGVVAAQPLLGLLGHGGLAIADIDGGLAGAPLPLLVLASLVAAVACRRAPHSAAVRALAGTLLGLGVTLAVLSAQVQPRWDLGQYYPTKAAWFGAVLVAPWLAGLLARPGARLAAAVAALVRDRGLVPRALVVLLPAAAGVAFVLPVLVVQGNYAWQAVQPADALDQRRLQVALTYPDRLAPAVVVPVAVGLQRVPEQLDSYLVAKLLRHRTGQPQTFGRLGQACTAVRDVAGDRPAVVVTDLTVREVQGVLRRQGCPGVRVVQVPGASPEALALVRAGAGLDEN